VYLGHLIGYRMWLGMKFLRKELLCSLFQHHIAL
jgi:hypothetical protein